MAGFYNDTFTDPNGTLLNSHTADSGETYTGGTGFKIQNNRLYSDNVSSPLSRPSGVTSTEGDKINIYFHKLTDAGNAGITYGDSTGGQFGYLVRVRDTQLLEIFSISFGSFTKITDYTFSIADNTDFKVTIEFSNTVNTKISIDDVVVIDVATAVPSVNGNVYFRQNQPSTTTTGYHIDKIEYVGQTPPYPNALYPVDVVASDSGHLQHHTADSGQLYDMNKGARIATNRLYFDDGAAGREATYIGVVDAATDIEYNIDLDLYRHTDAGNVGVAFGVADDWTTGWLLRSAPLSKIQLWGISSLGGALTFIDEYVHSTGDGASLPAVQAQVRSGQIEVFVGGVSRFTHATATTKEGRLLLRGNASVTDVTGYHLNSITYTSITNGAGGPLVYNDTFTTEANGLDSGTMLIADISRVTSAQTEADEVQAAAIELPVVVSANQTEAGDVQTAAILAPSSVAANQSEGGDVQTAAIAGTQTANVTAAQTEVAELQVAAIQVIDVANVSANQAETGDTQAADIDVVEPANVTSNQSESGDTQTANIGDVPTSIISATQTEGAEVQSASILVISPREVSANQVESGETQIAAVNTAGFTTPKHHMTLLAENRIMRVG